MLITLAKQLKISSFWCNRIKIMCRNNLQRLHERYLSDFKIFFHQTKLPSFVERNRDKVFPSISSNPKYSQQLRKDQAEAETSLPINWHPKPHF